MNKIQGILAAGTLTMTVIGAVVAFGRFTPQGNEATPAPDMNAVSDQQQQLQQELDLMRQREAEYAAQLQAANQTIALLESSQASGTPAGSAELTQAYQTITDLQASLAVMQQRESEYAAQIEAANQSILQLQAYVNQVNASQASAPQLPAGGGEHEDDDRGDEHEAEDDDD